MKSLIYVTTSAVALTSSLALADENTDIKPILDARLRYESVDQDGLEDANGLTLRLRAGFLAKFAKGWEILAEGEFIEHLDDDFADTVRVRPGQAVIADPESTELNRLQVKYSWSEGSLVTLGRQRIILGDARFVGNVGFRQNEQTFDAIRIDHKFNDTVSGSYIYIDKVRRIFGEDSAMGEWKSDSHIGWLKAKTHIGDLSAYTLLLDFENAAGASSQTYGVSWAKTYSAGEGNITLGAELAKQEDYGNSPLDFDLHFARVNAKWAQGAIDLSGGMEYLEGDGSRGFSTPLATLHKFQGWGDVFLGTPADGLRDVYAGIGYTKKNLSFGKSLRLSGVYHTFSDDSGDDDLGNEFDAIAAFKLNGRVTLSAKAAIFDGEDSSFADREKLWVAVDVKY